MISACLLIKPYFSTILNRKFNKWNYQICIVIDKMAKIMIVDDEPNILALEKAVLESEGFEVVEAISGAECLEKIKEAKPDLILLDMMMPGMSGRETCEKIRADPETSEQKIVFVTVARFSEVGKDILDELYVLDYVTKPFENADLISRVRKALDA